MLALSRAVVAVCVLSASLVGCAPTRATTPPPRASRPSYDSGTLFDSVVERLVVQFPEDALAVEELAAPHRGVVERATSRREELTATFAMLESFPSSHVALFSNHAHAFFGAELLGDDSITAGFFLARRGDHYAVSDVLAGGPAGEAGLRRGDVVTQIDGESPRESARLDLRTDDASLPDLPVHLVKVDTDERLKLEIVRDGATRELTITPGAYSSLRADRASVRVIESGGSRIGYLPLAYVYRHDTSAFVHESLARPLDGCDALVLDLRGRGGSQIGMWALMSTFGGDERAWTKPLVLLVDRETRSAKEILADWLRKRGVARIVGERTIGATRPARLYRIDPDVHLLCPSGRLDERTGLEGSGVEPDVAVEDPWFGGDAAGRVVRDVILDRGIEVAVEMVGE